MWAAMGGLVGLLRQALPPNMLDDTGVRSRRSRM